MIRVLLFNPDLRSLLPRFRDSRQKKLPNLLGRPTEQQPICPLHELLSEVTNFLNIMSNEGTITLPSSAIPAEATLIPPSPTSCKVISTVEDDRSHRRPQISNFLHDHRQLRAVDFSLFQSFDPSLSADTFNDLLRSHDDLLQFATQPLSCLPLPQFVSDPLPSNLLVSMKMPFDVSKHPDAQVFVAKQMLDRLEEDLKNHENILNGKKNVSLRVDVSDFKLPIEEKMEFLQKIEVAAKFQREKDLHFVQNSFSLIRKLSNALPLVQGAENEHSSLLHHLLSRCSGEESWIALEYVIAALVSTKAEEDILKVNPFLSSSVASEILMLMSISLCHANRLGHLNRVLSDCRSLRSLVKSLHSLLSSSHAPSSSSVRDVVLRIEQRVDALCTGLVGGRQYFTLQNREMWYDPRYLVFEFIWNILLRRKQVDMVDEFRKRISDGGSLCRQLIMGSGKTTVVSPLLCLMLGDKEHLVMEVVPPALLEFSRSILRSSFSSILQKRVYTFSFDRSSLMSEATLKKLRHARTDAGIVVSTPSAVKSLMLRYVENLFIIQNRATHSVIGRSARKYEKFISNQKKIVEALSLLSDQGILLCDEIDLLLHPLRSELNFPIGPKFDLDFSPLRWSLPTFVLNVILTINRLVTDSHFSPQEAYGMIPLANESKRLRDTLRRLEGALKEGYDARSLQQVPHLILLDREYYDNSLKAIVIELTSSWLTQHHFDEEILGEFDIARVLCNKHLLEQSSASQLMNSSNSLGKYYKMLNLAHDFVNSYLPHALSKIDRVTFGIMNEEDRKRAFEIDPFMPRTRWKLAIPFVSKDVPSRSSEFAHPDVIISLTFLAYRYEGLRFEDFTEVINAVRNQSFKEVGPIRQRKANKMYSQWVIQSGGKVKGEEKDEDDTIDAEGVELKAKDQKEKEETEELQTQGDLSQAVSKALGSLVVASNSFKEDEPIEGILKAK
jgi:hypothetical protein